MPFIRPNTGENIHTLYSSGKWYDPYYEQDHYSFTLELDCNYPEEGVDSNEHEPEWDTGRFEFPDDAPDDAFEDEIPDYSSEEIERMQAETDALRAEILNLNETQEAELRATMPPPPDLQGIMDLD